MKGPQRDPNSYRMLAVSGYLCRLYANVIRFLLITWCVSQDKIPHIVCLYLGQTQCSPCPSLGTCSRLSAPRSPTSLPACIPRWLNSNRPATPSPGRFYFCCIGMPVPV